MQRTNAHLHQKLTGCSLLTGALTRTFALIPLIAVWLGSPPLEVATSIWLPRWASDWAHLEGPEETGGGCGGGVLSAVVHTSTKGVEDKTGAASLVDVGMSLVDVGMSLVDEGTGTVSLVDERIRMSLVDEGTRTVSLVDED